MRLADITGSSVSAELELPTVTIACFREGNNGTEVLLERRGRPPAAGRWALPGGHVEPGETEHEAAIRELAEETGLRVRHLLPVGRSQGDPARGAGDFCFATKSPNSVVAPRSDALELRWVSVDRLPPLAFNQDRLVADALAKLYGPATAIESLVGYHPILAEATASEIEKLLDIKPSPDHGLLIVFEGIDGSGKSTAAAGLKKYLKGLGYDVVTTAWNSSPQVLGVIKKAKDKRKLSPVLYSLLHACDLLFRYQEDIAPALAADKIVVADRYIPTSLARDKVRGIDTVIHKVMFDGLREPDVLFHCSAPLHVAFNRLVKDKRLTYYGTGSDLHLADSREDNYLLYEKLIDEEYQKILPKLKSYHRLDMNRKPGAILDEVKKVLRDKWGIGRWTV